MEENLGAVSAAAAARAVNAPRLSRMTASRRLIDDDLIIRCIFRLHTLDFNRGGSGMLRTTFTAIFLGSAAFAASPSFHKEVEPILQKHCQECHRPGEIAPFSLLSYNDARPWAKA